MSIAPNVGALTNYLAKLRSRPMVQDLAQRAKNVVRKMPDPINKMAAGIRHGITHYLAPVETGTVFEEIGWEYIGPVDGHDLLGLLEIFRNVRELKGPVFVHAITVKGKGFESAEEDARRWHGVSPFDLESSKLTSPAGSITYTQAFGETALRCAREDDRVVAITAAMPDGTGLTRFAAEMPDRYFDVGIAEQHAVTFAAGLAAGGAIPFCAIYSTFLQRGFDQVLHDVAIQDLPVRFFLDRAGLVGDDGPTHHGAFDLSYLLPIPNLVVLSPRDTTELAEMIRWMAKYEDHPTVVRYPRGAGDDRLPESRTQIQYGRCEILREAGPSGRRILIAALGSMVAPAFIAATNLAKMDVECTVMNARFAKPIDETELRSAVRGCEFVLTVEENMIQGGFGASVREALSDHEIPVHTMGIPDRFIEHGAQPIIRGEIGLNEEGIEHRINELLRRGKVAARAT
jgi:1-deoxy-D-xylulose-5-phosphate synthase